MTPKLGLTHKVPSLIKYRNATYRLVVASRQIMYHGTSGGAGNALLTRILKEGLIPDPKKKAYDAPTEDQFDLDIDTKLSISLDESYGGIYLTNRLSNAHSYAQHAIEERGGNAVIIAVEVEMRTPGTALDEDLLFNGAFDFVDRKIDADTWYETDQKIENGEVKWTDIAADYLSDHLDLTLAQQRLDVVIPLLARALRAMYTYYLYKDHYDDIIEAAYKAGDEFFEFDYDAAESTLDDWRSTGQQVSLKLREAVEPQHSGMHNIRFTSPIRYSGANKIIAVASADKSKRITVHYATDKAQAELLAKELKH